MTRRRPARTTTRRTPAALVAGLLLVSAAIAAALAHQSPASSSQATASSSQSPAVGSPSVGSPPAAPPSRVPGVQHGDGLGEADGLVPDGATVFDDQLPAVGNLDAALLRALREAATEAADVGVELHVNSGWRSAAYQDQLLREAVVDHGSEAEAARWVATAETSAHVSGDAVDIGPEGAAAWLSRHGAGHGLCQVYRNEPWHYELRPGAVDDGCPPMYADPTQDPRTRP